MNWERVIATLRQRAASYLNPSGNSARVWLLGASVALEAIADALEEGWTNERD